MIILFLLFCFIILISLIYIENYRSNLPIINKKLNYDCIISINVHEKFNFLLKQLKNIDDNIKINYAIILNCNEYMFDECKNNILPDNVFIHPKKFNKQWAHGSITEGIYRNIKYALTYFNFKFFIVASSRNFFTNELTLDKLHTVIENTKIPDMQNNSYTDWSWPLHLRTKLAKYYLDKKLFLYNGAHEGLLFTPDGCKAIVTFLESHPEIKDDLFNIDCAAEEFSLQTIAINEGEMFYYIGNGVTEDTLPPNNDITNLKFMYKVIREGFINLFGYSQNYFKDLTK
jgi:hypothetical protein